MFNFDDKKRFTMLAEGVLNAGFSGFPLPKNYMFSIKHGFIRRFKKDPDLFQLRTAKEKKYYGNLIPYIFASPGLAVLHVVYSFPKLRSYLKPYRSKRALKRDLQAIIKTGRDLGIAIAALAAVVLMPLIIAVVVALAISMNITRENIKSPLFWLPLPFTFAFGLLLGGLAAIIAGPFLLTAALILLAKKVIDFALTPLVYVLGIPLRGILAGFTRLKRRFIPEAPFELLEKVKAKLAILDYAIQNVVIKNDRYRVTDSKRILILIDELHGLFRYATKKNIPSYIYPADEQKLYLQLTEARQQHPYRNSSVTWELFNAICEYTNLFHFERRANEVKKSSAIYSVYLALAEIGMKDPFEAITAPLALANSQEVPDTETVSAEFERQRLLRIVAARDDSAEVARTKRTEQITTFDGKQKIVPVRIAEVNKALLFVSNPRGAVKMAKKMQSQFGFKLKFPVKPK